MSEKKPFDTENENTQANKKSASVGKCEIPKRSLRIQLNNPTDWLRSAWHRSACGSASPRLRSYLLVRLLGLRWIGVNIPLMQITKAFPSGGRGTACGG
jgi:hypothetical protein